MTSPLNQDGSNFPCKVSPPLPFPALPTALTPIRLSQGYNTPEAYSNLKPVATLEAGTDFEIEFAPGGATHGGGSCQFSVR